MINFFKEKYSDLFDFIKNPKDQRAPIQTFSEKANKLLWIIVLDIPAMGIFFLMLWGLKSLGIFTDENHKILALLKSLSFSSIVLIFIVLIPVLEELIFRLYLRYKHNILARFFIFGFIITGRNNKIKIEEAFKRFWFKQYKYIFYFSAIIFGFVHVFNYDYNIKMLLLFPLLTAPQIVMGVFLGYMRVRFNIFQSIILHSLHNAIFVIPALFFMNSMDNIYEINKDYSIKIFESSDKTKEGKSIFSGDTLSFTNIDLKSVLSYALEKDAIFIKTNDNEKITKSINLYFKNKLKDKNESKRIILMQLKKQYRFKVSKEEISQDGWEIIVIDSTKLNRFKTGKIIPNFVTTSKDSVIIEGTKLSSLAYGISHAIEKVIITKIETNATYRIKLKVNNFIEMRNQLNIKYGLALKEIKQNCEYINIDFE
ncbi:MAG: CPBP family intramembrane glutamic endopeptidase [Paludibacter sp.]